MPIVSANPDSLPELPFQVISRNDSLGVVTGEYHGFPDACRLHNGDIVVVFNAGYGHTSPPNADYPTGGKLCLVRSTDEGRSWSAPRVVYDDQYDNRDPHVAQLSDGTLICSFFSLSYKGEDPIELVSQGVQLIRSHDNGATWETDSQMLSTPTPGWYCAAPVRQLADGTCILPMYYQNEPEAWGGVIRSSDGGETWSREIAIGRESGLFLPAETDVVALGDGSLLALLRGDTAILRGGSDINMHSATSRDGGQTWSPVTDMGFQGHAPHLNRLSNGTLLLAYRGLMLDDEMGDLALALSGYDWQSDYWSGYWDDKYTALRVSTDEGESWQGPFIIDPACGAYPSTVELRDGTILAVYYEEGPGSSIRALRFRLTELDGEVAGIEWLAFDQASPLCEAVAAR